MWVLVLAMCLLDRNEAAPLPGEQGSVQPFLLQQQVYQTTSPLQPSPSPNPAAGGRRTSSSSSSSSSSSESSHSSEDVQQLRQKQRLENAAVEQVDSSQESTELLSSPSSSLWVSELVILGQRAGEREGERSAGDDSAGSAESRQRALTLTFHPLLTRPQHAGGGTGLTASNPSGAAAEGGGAILDEGEVGAADVDEGGARGDEVGDVFPHSTERGLTFDSPGHTHHHGFSRNDAELELGL